MFELIAKLVGTILDLAVLKEKNKYVDKFIYLKKAWREEFSKPIGQRDNAALDNIEFELRLLASAITTVATKDSGPGAG